MRSPRRLFGALLVLLGAGGAALAQTSASYKLTESVFNAGGDPQNGTVAASASWRVTLDAIGDAADGVGLASASWHADAGFVDLYRPPGEVRNVLWPSKTTMTWSPEPTVGAYEVYRSFLSMLPGDFGSCLASGLTDETATDASAPPVSAGWFYIVTARNRLAEEGTKGAQSSGSERPNSSPCP
jgi:hypothetical protein